ncbi:hypothetical protein MRB53_041529 [Persea americana]|nr:hypothetical protein MRB53_041529 [Persea americana]
MTRKRVANSRTRGCKEEGHTEPQPLSLSLTLEMELRTERRQCAERRSGAARLSVHGKQHSSHPAIDAVSVQYCTARDVLLRLFWRETMRCGDAVRRLQAMSRGRRYRTCTAAAPVSGAES